MSQVQSPIAFVTGCSRGLGYAISKGLLQRGWDVHGLSRGPVPSELLAAGLVHHALDLASIESLPSLFNDPLAAELGLNEAQRVLLVNNAGVLSMAPIHNLDALELDRAMRINVTAPTWIAGWFVKHTGSDRRLDIVNISSGAADKPYPGWAAYCVGKAALRMAGRAVAADVLAQPALKGRPIHVLDYAPGVVDTAMQAEIRNSLESDFPDRARFVELHEQGQLVSPKQSADYLIDRIESTSSDPYEECRFE